MIETWIENMTWPAYQPLAGETDTIIFATGVMEEHGLHNPLGTDTIIAERCARIIGEKTGVPVAPSLPHGCAPDVKKFPGSTTLNPETYGKLLFAYCENFVRQGFKRIVIISGHSGNTPNLNILAGELYDRYGVLCFATDWWNILPQIDPAMHCLDHGSYFETSMMLATDESLVDMSVAHDVTGFDLTDKLHRKYYWRFDGANVGVICDMKMVNPYGNIGSPKRDGGASKELGNKMMQMYVNFMVTLVEEIKRIPMDA